MVKDLEAAGDLLAESDLVAAVAGDPDAQELVSAERNPDAAAADSPEDDYSVLDADSSQRNAIDAVLAGQSLVIHGTPGTGKSQTIANPVAALVARGRKVLFVAEKRAAIDAVLSRLKGADLGDMVLDIHEGTRDRQRIAGDLGATLDLAGQTATPDVGRLHRRLVDRVQRLSRHVSALHEAHEAAMMRLYAAIGQTLRTFDPAVYRSGPAALATAAGDGEGLGMLERRRLRGQARSLWRGAAQAAKPSWEELHAALDAAASQLAEC